MISIGRLKRQVHFASIAMTSKTLGLFNKDVGRSYLIKGIGEMPGLPAKAAQLLMMRSGFDKDLPQPKAMPLEVVKEIIEKEVPKLSNSIESIESEAQVASLGQVHAAKLKDGREVAIKVQFPEIEEEVKEQLELLLSNFSKYGPAKKYAMDAVAYRQHLEAQLAQEIDYCLEAVEQVRFGSVWTKSTFVVVPEVYKEYSNQKVLVQSFEESISLRDYRNESEEKRLDAAYEMTMSFLMSLFGFGFVHGDLQPGNFGFREKKLVLYDFGNTLKLEKRQVAILSQLIDLVIEDGEAVKATEVFDHFVALGFNAEKLSHIKDRLPELAKILFQPFLSGRSWKAKDYEVREKVETLLEGDSWWFRTAGPPWFLSLMKTCKSLLFALSELDVFVPVQLIYQNTKQSFPQLSLDQDIPPRHLDFFAESLLTKRSQGAKNLRVSVKEGSDEIVSLTMPVASVDDLELLVAPEVREKIEAGGYDLLAIKEKAQKSGYEPGVLFDAVAGHRTYKVWLV